MLTHLEPTGQETLCSQLSVLRWSQDPVLALALLHSSWPCSRAVMRRTWPYWTSPRGKTRVFALQEESKPEMRGP